jgi:two-component system NtrC family sensor kinase
MEGPAPVAYGCSMADRTGAVEARMLDASRQPTARELAAIVAHEINNPLTAVLGYAELLLEEQPLDSPIRRELETIRDETLRARDIVRVLADVAARTVDERTPRPDPHSGR